MKKIKIGIIILLILLIPILVITIADNYFSKRTEEYLEYAVTFASSDIFSDASNLISKYDIDKILKYQTNEKNEITSIYINTPIANQALTDISNIVSNALNSNLIEEKLGFVDISLGQLFSRGLFADMGPNIRIHTSPISSYTTDLLTSSTPQGINNTLFELYVKVVINVEAFIPLLSKNIAVESKICLSSMLVQGDVPVYYLSI